MAKQPRKTRATLDSKFEAAALAASRHSEELKEAESKLAPLRKQVAKARALRDKLYEQMLIREGVSVASLAVAPRRGRKPGRKATGEKRTYNIDPAKKVEATYKRTLTRLVNSGTPKAEAEKRAKENADALRKKLGVK